MNFPSLLVTSSHFGVNNKAPDKHNRFLRADESEISFYCPNLYSVHVRLCLGRQLHNRIRKILQLATVHENEQQRQTYVQVLR